MNKGRKLLSKAAHKMDIPADALAGVPRLELVGFTQCSIEPHKGLLEYGEREIILDSHSGQIIFTGQGLHIKAMNAQRVIVCGIIECIRRGAPSDE